jgi:hypothetical protein
MEIHLEPTRIPPETFKQLARPQVDIPASEVFRKIAGRQDSRVN